MPTFTAIALERLIEPGASKSVDKTLPSSKYPPIPKPEPLPNAKPGPGSNLARRNSTTSLERKPSRPQISPSLYATPESTPLPDSPSSFPPSPYIINHKRRGPRLLKSASEVDVASQSKGVLGEDVVDGDVSGNRAEAKVVVDWLKANLSHAKVGHGNGVHDVLGKAELTNGFHDAPTEEQCCNGLCSGDVGESNGEAGNGSKTNGVVMETGDAKLDAFDLERDANIDDFFDPQETMSYASNTDVEDNLGAESSLKLAGSAQTGEFYDACEELSSESGTRLPSLQDIEAELREIRLNLPMEIEKRKQAEEALTSMLSHWQRIRQQLALVGLTLPAFHVAIAEGEPPPDFEPAEELCQQVNIARFVANSIGRGTAKAEMEMEMEDQLEAKNFEIARLWDRLHYYEAMNREMSQRNQEAVEMVRRNRMVRRRRQRWFWGSIAAAITLGTAALAWSYLAPAQGSSSNDDSLNLEHDDATEQ